MAFAKLSHHDGWTAWPQRYSDVLNFTRLDLTSLFVPSLFSYHEKATVALYYFGRIRTRLGVVHFRVFLLFL